MMKKILTFILVIGFLLISITALAQETDDVDNPTESPAATVNDDKVQELKDKLATKVAELRKEQKRGYYGEISALSKSTFTLATETEETRVRWGEDVQVFEMGRKVVEVDTDELANTLKVSVLGFFDETEELLHAKTILIQTIPQHYYGRVLVIDTKTGTFAVAIDEDEITFDYERTTRAYEYSTDSESLKKGGLSRLNEDDLLHIWAVEDEDDEILNATRILRVPKEMFALEEEATEIEEDEEVEEETASPEPTLEEE